MTHAMYRKSTSMRLLSVFVVFAFLLSTTGGVGFASPGNRGDDGRDRPVAQEPAPAPTPDQSGGKSGGKDSGAPAGSVEAAPVTDVPEESPKARPGRAEQPSSSPRVERETPAPTADAEVAPVAAAAPVSAAVAGGGGSVQLTLEGYRTSPNTEWSTGNLGLYYEDEWVPYRLIVDNTGGAAPVDLGVFGFTYDHYLSTKNAIAVDATRYYRVAYTTTAPTKNDANVLGGSAISPASHDAGGFGTADRLATTFSAGTVVVPAGHYAVVYYQAHLAVTPWWMTQSPSRFGSGFYPGSSTAMRLFADAGDKTVPIPIPPQPDSDINGIKFHDLNEDGNRDAGEPALAGWVFHLTGGTGAYGFDLTATSDSNGEFSFPELPAGAYSLTEESKAGWDNSTPLPMSITLVSGQDQSIEVGNFHIPVTKTFSLSFSNAPEGATFFARYSTAAGAVDVPLVGSGPTYTGSVELPYGTIILSTGWYAQYNGEDILLGTTQGETLTRDMTNSFDYNASVAGSKFSDSNGNGLWDAGEIGLGGWEIKLYRAGLQGEVLYDSATTATDGSYSFGDVLPGTYRVAEVQQPGWLMMVSPQGTFAVAHATALTSLDFGNMFLVSDILVEKSGVAAAHEGDTIPYDFVVTNTGNHTLYNVLVTDPLMGVSVLLPTLEPGVPYSFSENYTIPAGAPDPLPNRVDAVGYDAFERIVTSFDTHEVDILKPEIAVVKTVDPEKIVNGQSVVYTYVVTNTGEETLYDVSVVDDILGPVGTLSSLAAGQSHEFTLEVDPDQTVTNVATAEGYDELEKKVTDTDDAVVEVYNPAISIVKSASQGVLLPGELVTYTYLVTNTGDIDLYNVSVTDDILGPIGIIPFLAKNGGFDTVSTTVMILEDVTNIGTARGYYGERDSDFFGFVEASEPETVDVINPAIDVVKTADKPIVVSGTLVTYSFSVDNIGDVTLFNIAVQDDKLGPIGVIPVLAPEDPPVVLTATHVMDETTTNVVTAVGMDIYEHVVTDTDDETVQVFNPAIDILKWASPTTILTGQSVTYTYLVTNTGDIDLHDVVVTDDKLGAIGTIPFLAKSGGWDILTSTQPILSDVTNVGTARGEYGEIDSDFGGYVEDSDDAVVDVIHPAIDIEKTANPTTVLAGETVLYTLVVRNAGDVPLFNVDVTDPTLSYATVIPNLAVGQTTTLTVSAPVTVDTLNVATAVGRYLTGQETGYFGTVTDTDDAVVDVVRPAIDVEKTPSTGFVAAGEIVTYTYVVTNTGDTTLINMVATDDKLGVVGTAASLDPGASVTFTKAAPIDAPTTNIVVATATDRMQHPVSDSDTAFVDVFLPFTAPDLVIEKSVDKATADPGELVTFTLTYWNIGEGAALDYVITDDYDERYVEVVSAPDGTVDTSAGTITWEFPGPLYAEDGEQTITYTVRVKASMPIGTTIVRNVVVITEEADEDTSNNSDKASFSVTVGEPFLPFTGMETGIALLLALMAALAGLALRRLGHTS